MGGLKLYILASYSNTYLYPMNHRFPYNAYAIPQSWVRSILYNLKVGYRSSTNTCLNAK